MYIDPISLGVSAVGFGLNMWQNRNADNARQQDYLNQVAYQDATSQFNNWQSGFNARTKDLNNQYSYWGETLNYNQNNIYSKQLANYEFARELQQAQQVIENRVSASANYALTSQALQANLQERGDAGGRCTAAVRLQGVAGLCCVPGVWTGGQVDGPLRAELLAPGGRPASDSADERKAAYAPVHARADVSHREVHGAVQPAGLLHEVTHPGAGDAVCTAANDDDARWPIDARGSAEEQLLDGYRDSGPGGSGHLHEHLPTSQRSRLGA